MDKINWLSMVLATMTPMIIGFFYFHKAMFGKVWMDSSNITNNKLNVIVTFALSIVFSFFLSFFLLNFNNGGINQEGNFDTFAHGAWHGVFIAVTTVIPVIVINGLFGKKAWKNMLISIFYWIITLALMGGILDAMNHWENVLIPEG